MSQAIVMEPFGYVGFELCNHLLSEGIMIFYPEHWLINDEYQNEKELLIGRNSNFQKLQLAEFLNPSEKTIKIFLPFYDWLFVKTIDENQLQTHLDSFFQQLPIQNDDFELIILWPLVKYEIIKKWKEYFHPLIGSEKMKIFYLPTLYGKWQPQSFLFQQMLSKQFDVEQLEKSGEDKIDALYIEDCIQTICKHIDEEGHLEISLKNVDSHRWYDCAAYLLGENECIQEEEQNNENHWKCIYVKESRDYKDILNDMKKMILARQSTY